MPKVKISNPIPGGSNITSLKKAEEYISKGRAVITDSGELFFLDRGQREYLSRQYDFCLRKAIRSGVDPPSFRDFIFCNAEMPEFGVGGISTRFVLRIREPKTPEVKRRHLIKIVKEAQSPPRITKRERKRYSGYKRELKII